MSEAKPCLETEFRSHFPDLFFFFFSHQINSACEGLLFLRLSQDEPAFAGGAVIWEPTILYKGSLDVKQKHFCFAFEVGWAQRIDLFLLQS